MAPLTVVFAGTPDLAVPTLEELIADPLINVALVITQPDRPRGRKKIITPPPIKKKAEEAGIPIWQPEDINEEWSACPVSDPPDLFITFAYGQIVKRDILDWPRIAALNVHPSLLPHLRGASPIHNAIVQGDTMTGISLQRMVEELDAGPIVAQTAFPLDPRITYQQLHDDIARMAGPFLVETLKAPLQEQEQDETHATYCTKLSRAMGTLDHTSMNAEDIDRHVRALVPWPGVRIIIDGEDVKLTKTALDPSPDALMLPCRDSTLYIEMLKPEGRKEMTGAAWERGRNRNR